MRRRDLLAGLPAGLALASAALLPRFAGAAPALQVTGWRGYEDPVFFGAFARRHGLPDYRPRDAGNEALAALRAGQETDVGQPCLHELGAWIDTGVALPLDTARLSNWADVWRPLRLMAPGPAEGTVWCAPFDWGAAALIVRSDLAADLPASWWVLFDERHGGRVGMQRSPEPAVGTAALALGLGRSGAFDEAGRRAVVELIARQQQVAVAWTDPEEAERGLASGALMASYGWNDMYARLRSRGVPVRFVIPQEGPLLWACGLVRVASGSADPELVHEFVDAMLAPSSGAALIARYGYGHANRRAFDLVPPEVLGALALDAPSALLNGGLLMGGTTPGGQAETAAMFEAAISGS